MPAGAEPGTGANFRIEGEISDETADGFVRAFRGCRLGEPPSGSESGAAAALRALERSFDGIRDGMPDKSLLDVFVCRFEGATSESSAESGVSASLSFREELVGESGNGALTALGAGCLVEAATGIGANSKVRAADGVVK